MPTQDPDELLKHKKELDEQRNEFAHFVRNISEDAPIEKGQEFLQNDRGEPDQQNQLKDQENRRM